jgi:hypothetical protein
MCASDKRLGRAVDRRPMGLDLRLPGGLVYR